MPPLPRKLCMSALLLDIEHQPFMPTTMKEGWTSQLYIRDARPIDLTINIADYLRDEADSNEFPERPDLVIQRVKRDSCKFSETTPELWQTIEDSLVQLVYSSNFIELTGSSYRVTDQLCRKVFRGEKVDAVVEERSQEYQDARDALLAQFPDSAVTRQTVYRSRQEVINHARALDYAIEHFVLDSEPISELFLKECHKILCDGVLDSDAGYAGEYRTWEIAARHGMKKNSQFIRAKAVPSYMAELVRHIEEDLIMAETSKALDPFDMASRCCHRFVCIHPFGDGNGRMCRILLNIILLKYGGHVSCFGGTEAEREEYLDLAQRANKQFHVEDMEMEEHNKTGHRELAKLILRKSKRTLSDLWRWCVSNQGLGLQNIH
ncbi:fido domain-containing protein [Xylariaceae sp. FL1019]|nr:fido domain-containing protein [Xylariaceae sp. FL1019]